MIETPTHPFHAAVDLLQQLAAGPMSGAPLSERVTLLSLEAARERGEDVTMSGLSARLGMSRAGVTTVVDRLEADGYVSRTPLVGDRRVTHLVITTAGSQHVDDALAFDADAEAAA